MPSDGPATGHVTPPRQQSVFVTLEQTPLSHKWRWGERGSVCVCVCVSVCEYAHVLRAGTQTICPHHRAMQLREHIVSVADECHSITLHPVAYRKGSRYNGPLVDVQGCRNESELTPLQVAVQTELVCLVMQYMDDWLRGCRQEIARCEAQGRVLETQLQPLKRQLDERDRVEAENKELKSAVEFYIFMLEKYSEQVQKQTHRDRAPPLCSTEGCEHDRHQFYRECLDRRLGEKQALENEIRRLDAEIDRRARMESDIERLRQRCVCLSTQVSGQTWSRFLSQSRLNSELKKQCERTSEHQALCELSAHLESQFYAGSKRVAELQKTYYDVLMATQRLRAENTSGARRLANIAGGQRLSWKENYLRGFGEQSRVRSKLLKATEDVIRLKQGNVSQEPEVLFSSMGRHRMKRYKRLFHKPLPQWKLYRNTAHARCGTVALVTVPAINEVGEENPTTENVEHVEHSEHSELSELSGHSGHSGDQHFQKCLVKPNKARDVTSNAMPTETQQTHRGIKKRDVFSNALKRMFLPWITKKSVAGD